MGESGLLRADFIRSRIGVKLVYCCLLPRCSCTLLSAEMPKQRTFKNTTVSFIGGRRNSGKVKWELEDPLVLAPSPPPPPPHYHNLRERVNISQQSSWSLVEIGTLRCSRSEWDAAQDVIGDAVESRAPCLLQNQLLLFVSCTLISRSIKTVLKSGHHHRH